MKKVLFTILILINQILLYAQTPDLVPDSIYGCGADSVTYTVSGSYNNVYWYNSSFMHYVEDSNIIAYESGLYYVIVTDSTLGDTAVCFSASDISPITVIQAPAGYVFTKVLVANYGTPVIDCNNPLPGGCQYDAKAIIDPALRGRSSLTFNMGGLPDMCSGTPKTLYVKARCLKAYIDSVNISILNTSNEINIADSSTCTWDQMIVTIPEMSCDTTYITVDNLTLTNMNDKKTSVTLEAGHPYRLIFQGTASFGGGSGNQYDGAYQNITSTPNPFIIWRWNGTCPADIPSYYRPQPDGYNPSHIYYYYFTGRGTQEVFEAYDCCLGDNSGSWAIEIQKVIINEGCNQYYLWSGRDTGNSVSVSPGIGPHILYISNNISSCPIDTFYYTHDNIITSDPSDIITDINDTVYFTTYSSDTTLNFQWQADFGGGFQNIADTSQYYGTNRDTLFIFNTLLQNNGIYYQCIIDNGNCTDTTLPALLTVIDMTDIAKKYENENLLVYPNPFQNSFTIEKRVYGPIHIIISDIQGRILFKYELFDLKNNIALNHLSNGIYFLSIQNSLTKPIIIIKE